MPLPVKRIDLLRELVFATSRSGGPGGQHANKTSTQVSVWWNVPRSALLLDDEKSRFKRYLTAKGDVLFISRASRSQADNKEAAIRKVEALIRKVLTPKKSRRPTQPSAASVRRRLNSKKQQAGKKRTRQQKPERDAD